MGGTTPDSPLDLELATAEQKAREKDIALEEHGRRHKDRSFLAKLTGWSFVLLVAWVVIVTTVGAAYYDWETLAEPAKYLMTILGSVMLPVVTLVIGHYFGKEERCPSMRKFLPTPKTLTPASSSATLRPRPWRGGRTGAGAAEPG